MPFSHCPKCGHTLKLYNNPVPTVDIIIEVKEGIVLIDRKNLPFGWALPGGFVDYGESLEEAAVREAKEETNLDIELKSQLGAYSNPDRDARLHTISYVFIAAAHGHPKGMDDAKKAAIFSQGNIPKMAFDHEKILQDYFLYKK